jgi:hypothetical protein
MRRLAALHRDMALGDTFGDSPRSPAEDESPCKPGLSHRERSHLSDVSFAGMAGACPHRAHARRGEPTVTASGRS